MKELESTRDKLANMVKDLATVTRERDFLKAKVERLEFAVAAVNAEISAMRFTPEYASRPPRCPDDFDDHNRQFKDEPQSSAIAHLQFPPQDGPSGHAVPPRTARYPTEEYKTEAVELCTASGVLCGSHAAGGLRTNSPRKTVSAVSYTHLTLPTILLV